jgi:uncharacterized protein (DUF2267 family)
MEYGEFVKAVAAQAGLPEEQAEQIVLATFMTLAERISGGQASDLAAQLPEPISRVMQRPRFDPAQGFDVDEFAHRVMRRAQVGPDEARAGMRAVLLALQQAVSPEEFEDMMSELPAGYRRLVESDARAGSS